MSNTSSAAGVNALCGTLLTLTVVTVSLRFYTRTLQRLPFSTDDWAMVPCVLFYLGACVVVFIGVNDKVFGYATESFTTERVMSMAKLSAQIQIAWDTLSTCALACIKISALFFYRRIFCIAGLNSKFNLITQATAMIVFLWLVTFLFFIGFQCGSHISALGDDTYFQYCTISFPFLYGLVISDLLLDVWILLLPIPEIIKLHTTTQRKFAISGVFLLGFIGLGASTVRMVVYIQTVSFFSTAGPKALIKYDEELTVTKGLYLSMLEAGMSLIAVNLPSLWFLCSKRTLELSLRSIRSVLSLRSWTSSVGSRHRDNTSRMVPQRVATDRFLSSSCSNIIHDADGEAYESFSMHGKGDFDVENGAGKKA